MASKLLTDREWNKLQDNLLDASDKIQAHLNALDASEDTWSNNQAYMFMAKVKDKIDDAIDLIESQIGK